MTRYILRRVALSLVTLFLIVTIVFLINNVFPSDVGRRLAGPFQSQEVVDQINEELGTNDPLPEQYGRLVKGVVTFDWGESYAQNKPVSDVIGDAFWKSIKLALYALVLTIPLSILAGIVAARRHGHAHRSWHRHARSRQLVDPRVRVERDPAGAHRRQARLVQGRRQPAEGRRASLTQLNYLTLPAFALVIVYFGYIARMTRAGVIRALDADYTRTATMKGLAPWQVMRRHVLRNGLQPTVSVVGVQVGYVLGSLVAIEKVFNYPGLGLTIANAAAKDPPVLVAGVLRGRHRVHARDPGRRPDPRLDEPTGPPEGDRHDRGRAADHRRVGAAARGAGALRARRRPARALAAAPPPPGVHLRLARAAVLARLRDRRRARQPARCARRSASRAAPCRRRARTRSAPTSSAATCCPG